MCEVWGWALVHMTVDSLICVSMEHLSIDNKSFQSIFWKCEQQNEPKNRYVNYPAT